VLISILLYSRNRATNIFPLIVGLFLASTGSSKRVMDTFHNMGLSVSYRSVQRALQVLSKDAKRRAREFISNDDRLWGVVYDNINFTLRKASQRLDSTTQQINATTLAIFSLPVKFTRAAYGAALSVFDRNKKRGDRSNLSISSLQPTPEKQKQVTASFNHAVASILVQYLPGAIQSPKQQRKLRKKIRKMKPFIRKLGHEKTEFFPLPALDEEEASVSGTIKVIKSIFNGLLDMATDVIPSSLRLIVGDWLTIQNLRLVRTECQEEEDRFLKFDWVQEAAMPFHFQLNGMYCLYRMHLGLISHNDPSCLEHHRTLLRRAKLDLKKPEYNKAKELLLHSLAARLIDCLRCVVQQFTTSAAASAALRAQDEVMAHSILFIRDALFFWEFCDAIRDADVGRMWLVYDFWVFMFRGAGCHNYGNEILEMKGQFEHEFPPLLRDLVERTWLVNRWGIDGRSIPTDLYLEHNNGFTKVSNLIPLSDLPVMCTDSLPEYVCCSWKLRINRVYPGQGICKRRGPSCLGKADGRVVWWY
ncbi:hypothetical protein BKA70DRAFT_1103795, partial [Coprinopsis sp. MPI-PUGE-AT-0042]